MTLTIAPPAALAEASPEEVRARRPALTTDHTDGQDPRPSTLATQELRLALTFTGGVSLAVWMGGVARELNLLVQASDGRRTLTGGTGVPPVNDPLVRYYRRLLDLTDVQVSIDVLAGTSAGGINAAVLGLANARGIDIGALRDIWIHDGDLERLLRDPREKAPPSLLKGDAGMLAALHDGIHDLITKAPRTADRHRTEVAITTTLLSPETSRYADDYGTLIGDDDHHAVLRFSEEHLVRRDIAAPLALAARSSASFPGAFEPSFLPRGAAAADPADRLHPDMTPYLATTRSHWAADGGLLANRPLAPVLQAIFDREADRQVRRALLYVVPTSVAPATEQDSRSAPLTFAGALKRDLAAALSQSIAGDLTAIKDHNDAVGARADTRLRLAALGARLPEGVSLADADTWAAYRLRQGNALVTPLLTALSRALADLPDRPAGWAPDVGMDQDATLRAAALGMATRGWPDATPTSAETSLAAAAGLGRPAFDAAKATVRHMLRLAYVLSSDVEQRCRLAKYDMRTQRAFSDHSRLDLDRFTARWLAVAAGRTAKAPLASVAAELTGDFLRSADDPGQLAAAWTAVGRVVADAFPLLTTLADRAPAEPGSSTAACLRPTVNQRRDRAADQLRCYLAFIARTDAVTALLDLHVATRSLQPVRADVDQPVELIQVSADTRTALAPDHATASSKLTGLQMHHFGAFYAPAWRANDWRWGRLDGCGWIVHLLLDPRRILAVLENDGVAPRDRVATFAAALGRALDHPVPESQLGQLAFLADPDAPLPVSLPKLALWAAETLQRHVAADELRTVAKHLEAEDRRTPAAAARRWLTELRQWEGHGALPADSRLPVLLNSCPVPGQTLVSEAGAVTPRYVRTVTKAAAVTTAAGTGFRKPPATLRPIFGSARTVALTAYAAGAGTGGRRARFALAGVLAAVFGALAVTTTFAPFGLAGAIAVPAGVLIVAFSLGRRLSGALGVLAVSVVAVLAAAPYLPWLGQELFSWLERQALPWIQAHRWPWPVLLLFLLLPALSEPVRLATVAGRGVTRRLRIHRLRKRPAVEERPAVAPATT